MRGRAAGGDERRSDRTLVLAEVRLDPVQSGEELLERPTGERRPRRFRLALCKCGEPALLVDALRFIGEEHGIAVESDAQLVALVLADGAWKDRRRRMPVVERAAHITLVRGK